MTIYDPQVLDSWQKLIRQAKKIRRSQTLDYSEWVIVMDSLIAMAEDHEYFLKQERGILP